MIAFRIGVALSDLMLAVAFIALVYRTVTATSLPSPTSLRRHAGSLLIGVTCFILLGSGSLKLAHVPEVVDEMTSLSLAGWKLDLVGTLELTSGLLLLV